MASNDQMNGSAAGPQLSPPADTGPPPSGSMAADSQAQMMHGYAQYMNQMNPAAGGQYPAQMQQQPGAYYGAGNGVPAGSYGEDPLAAYMAAAQQQQAAAYYAGGMGAYGGGMGAGYYGGSGYPGPSYYDPHGMINPAACVAPVQTQLVGGGMGGAGQTNKGGRKKKSGSWCC